MKRGQASVELILLMSGAFVVILIFLALSSRSFLDLGLQQNTEDARATVQTLSQAADSVYAQGEGASKTVLVKIPPGTVFGSNSTYIGRPSYSANASPNIININLAGTDIFAASNAPLTGSFPNASGAYSMKVVSRGGFVSIGSHIIETSPSSVHVTMKKNERKSFSLMFDVVQSDLASGQSVRVVLSSPWNYTDVALSNNIWVFSSYATAKAPILLQFSAGSNASGIYSSQLNVNATSPISEETFSIPIVVSVQ